MKKILIALGLLFSSGVSYAQGGCSDAGVCTLGGHSTSVERSEFPASAGLVQTFALGHDYSYFETVPRIAYDFEIFKVDLSILYRFSSALYESIVETTTVKRGSGKVPSTQHVTKITNRIESHYALGDAKFTIAVPLPAIDERIKLNLAYSQPLTKLYEDRPQEMQSTLGLPALLVGASFDNGDTSLALGATVAYETTFHAQNSLHLTRADDFALALRMRGKLSTLLAGGLDMSFIHHLDDDKLHGIPTSNVLGYEKTSGLTINVGGSLSAEVTSNTWIGVYVAAPIVSKAHVDGLERVFVSGLFVTKAW
jgi:hypothetical protein